MIRRLVAGLIVVGLAVGIWALWPSGEDSGTSTSTTAVAVASTTPPEASTTAVDPVPTTSPEGAHVVSTVTEAEEILRLLWFGWFEGIYNQDEDRIREVVGTQALLDAAVTAFNQMSFLDPPAMGALAIEDLEILRSDAGCLAIWVSGSAPFVDATSTSIQSVEVLRWTDQRWVLVSSWQNRQDLWEADCESQLESLS